MPEPKIYKYIIRMLNGEAWEVGSPFEWTIFWSIIMRDRYVVSANGFAPYHAIATIVPSGEKKPGEIIHLASNNDGMPKQG